jgi:hypothetical protein
MVPELALKQIDVMYGRRRKVCIVLVLKYTVNFYRE